MWKHFQAGGLGAALRPPMGAGRSPGGAQGQSPRKLMDFTHLQSIVFYVKSDPLFDFCLRFLLHDFTCKKKKPKKKNQKQNQKAIR